MRIIEKKLWDDEDSKVSFTAYLHDNSKEIDENRTRPMVIVCPGGGYMSVSDREAEPVALMYLGQGFNAVVLEYTTKKTGIPVYPRPLMDLAKMVATVRANADEWSVDPDKVAICGFSAGANLAASLGVHWHRDFLSEKLNVTNEQIKPNALILGYAVYDYVMQLELMKDDPDANKLNSYGGTNYGFMQMIAKNVTGGDLSEESLKKVSPLNYVNENVPPCFLWHTAADDLDYVVNTLRFGQELFKYSVPFEMHVFEKGLHGLSLADSRTANKLFLMDEDAAKWADLSVSFLKRRFNMK